MTNSSDKGNRHLQQKEPSRLTTQKRKTDASSVVAETGSNGPDAKYDQRHSCFSGGQYNKDITANRQHLAILEAAKRISSYDPRQDIRYIGSQSNS